MPESDFENILYWSDVVDATTKKGSISGGGGGSISTTSTTTNITNSTTTDFDLTYDRYDIVRAQPPDNELRIMWSIYSFLLFCFSLGIMIIFLGIITNKRVRKNPFNKYILFLSFPDFIYSFLCFITCILSAIQNEYAFGWYMCQFQTFYLYFGASANSWLNAVIAYEVYRLLRSSNIRQRYFPPTNYQVYRNSIICYGIAILAGSIPLVATWLQWDDWFPTPGIQAGFLCQATEYSLSSTLYFWFFIAPLIFGIPYIFATYVFVDVVWYTKLLPPKGRRRELSIYFFRIAAMFAFLWCPTFFVMYALRGIASPWFVWSFGAFSHTQGLVSAVLTLYKQDIRLAVYDFIKHPIPKLYDFIVMVYDTCRRSCCCCCCGKRDQEQTPQQQDGTEEEPSSSYRFGLRFSSFRLSESISSRRLLRFSLDDHKSSNNNKKNNYKNSVKGGRSPSAALIWRLNMESREMGLPVQDADFQFADERTPSSTFASGIDESVVMTASGRHHQQQQLHHDAEDGNVVDDNEVEDEEERVEPMGDSLSKNTEEEVEDGVVVDRVDDNDEDGSIVSC